MTTWYKTGTVTVTNGNATVTGSGTAWVANVRIGDAFHGPDGAVYEIANVVSDTSLTLAKNYGGSSASGQTYAVQPTRGIIRNFDDTVRAWLDVQQGYVDGSLLGRFTDGTAGAPGISFIDDTDTGFIRSGANVFDVVTGGTSRWQWSADGLIPTTNEAVNVGADAKRPSAFIHDLNVNGALTLPAGGIATAALADGAATTAKIADAAVTLAKQANLDQYRVIGRSSSGAGVPEALTPDNLMATLNQASSTDLADARLSANVPLRNADITPSADATYDIGSTSARFVEGHVDLFFAAVGSAAAPTYSFEGDANTGMWSPAADALAWSTGGTERMRITSAGNVGVNTSSPLARLHVRGGGEIFRVSVDVDANVQQEFGIGFATGPNTHPAARIDAVELDASDSRVALAFSTRDTNSDVAPTERLRITSGGNVGIGTDAPSTSLHVNGPIRMGSYTVATVPAAATVGAGTIIYVSDETGGAIPAFSDGTAWRRVSDRAVIA